MTVECCRREGDRLSVPSRWGELHVIAERSNGDLLVKEKGRWSGRGHRRRWVPQELHIIRLRPYQPGESVMSSYHLNNYDRQVMEVIESHPWSRRTEKQLQE